MLGGKVPPTREGPRVEPGARKETEMNTSDYLSIISLVITMVMGLPGTILAIIQIRDALKPGKGHQRPHRRLRGHRLR